LILIITAISVRVAGVVSDALASGSVIGGITECINSALLLIAWILAGLAVEFAVTVVGAVFVALAFRHGEENAITCRGEFVAVFFWTDAVSSLVNYHSPLEGTHAMAILDLVALVLVTNDALVIDVERRARSANTLTTLVDDFVGRTVNLCIYVREKKLSIKNTFVPFKLSLYLTFVALKCCISLVAWQALTNHCERIIHSIRFLFK
jgi:hypothetical protein